MEKLFKMKGIGLVKVPNSKNNAVYYAYNSDLLSKNTIIEFYDYLDEDEINDIKGESFEDVLKPKPLRNTVISVFLIDDVKEISHKILAYYNQSIIPVYPISILQIIDNLVEYIGMFDQQSLISNLNDITIPSSAVLRGYSSDSFIMPEHAHQIYKEDLELYQKVLKEIDKKG